MASVNANPKSCARHCPNVQKGMMRLEAHFGSFPPRECLQCSMVRASRESARCEPEKRASREELELQPGRTLPPQACHRSLLDQWHAGMQRRGGAGRRPAQRTPQRGGPLQPHGEAAGRGAGAVALHARARARGRHVADARVQRIPCAARPGLVPVGVFRPARRPHGAHARQRRRHPVRHRTRRVYDQGQLLGSLCSQQAAAVGRRARPAADWPAGDRAPGAAPCDAKMRSRLCTPAARSAMGALPGSGAGAPNCSPRKPCTRPARMRSPAARRRRAGSAASAPGSAGRTTVRCCPSHSSQNSWRRAQAPVRRWPRRARGAR